MTTPEPDQILISAKSNLMQAIDLALDTKASGNQKVYQQALHHIADIVEQIARLTSANLALKIERQRSQFHAEDL